MEKSSVSIGGAATKTLQGIVFSSKCADGCKHSDGRVALYRHLARFSGDTASCAVSAAFCLYQILIQRQRWKQAHALRWQGDGSQTGPTLPSLSPLSCHTILILICFITKKEKKKSLEEIKKKSFMGHVLHLTTAAFTPRPSHSWRWRIFNYKTDFLKSTWTHFFLCGESFSFLPPFRYFTKYRTLTLQP